MEQFLIGWDGVMVFDPGENAEDVLDLVMEFLLKADLVDPTITYDAGTSKVTFETIALEDDVLGAVAKATSAVRSALHAAGVITRDWREPDRITVTFGQAPSVRHLVDA
jgi:hypothetical protein